MPDRERDTLYIGLDVERSSCRLHAVDADGRLNLRRSVAHGDLTTSLPATTRKIVGLEYRSSAHELAFKLSQAGYDVRLIRFRDIPWMRDGTSDAAFDRAEALCEAVRTGSTRHVTVLAPDQQGHAASERVKALLKRQRSAVASAARNLADLVDTDRRSIVGNDRDVADRLGSVSDTSAFHPASSALLGVLLALERSIASFEPVAAP